MRFLAVLDVFRLAGIHEASASVASLWTKVYHPVGSADHIKIVLHYHNRMSLCQQCVK